MERPATIRTERLTLVALLPEEVGALMAGDEERAGRSGLRFPAGWPDDPGAREGLPWHLRALQTHPGQLPWRIRVISERATTLVVGSVNLKGPPDEHGDVEIGWGVSATHRRRGYAFEAAAALMAWTATQPGVTSISATVPDDNVPSRRLASKLGLVRTDATRRDLPLWRRSLTRVSQ